MSKFDISKAFEFDYGHRVWVQELNPKFSLDSCLACRHIHGHRGVVEFHLIADKLNDQAMVTDFKHLNFMKKFIDDVLDHKLILHIHDPVVKSLFSKIGNFYTDLLPIDFGNYFVVTSDLLDLLPKYEREVYEGLILVNFVPTSEELSRWLHGIAQEKLTELGVTVDRVVFKETPKSQSTYIA